MENNTKSKNTAEAGSASAMLDAANMHSTGNGVQQDLKRAFDWFMKAAEARDSIGMYQAGSACRFGEGVEKDLTESFLWSNDCFPGGAEYSVWSATP